MSDFALVLVALGLVVFRITSLLVNEDGPLDIFLSLRKAVGVIVDGSGQSIGARNPLAKVFTCVRCMSIWVSIPFALYMTVTYAPLTAVPQIVLFLAYDLALSALSILFDRIAG